ncbi:MAG TPA: hypothetical protein VMS76_09795 [Planctomycetota bacterium]|nr:hypothetical protein [Planctomycetota bacterium]
MRRPIELVSLALLFAWAVLVSLHYGRRGYMPLDQSIVFDGGWRILCGQVPFRDFHTPNGITPIVMQAAFFALFGETWFAYCLHAALINGLFALVVCWLLAALDLPLGWALLYAALSSLLLYPPFGVPYMDQHAFFFSLAALALAVASRGTHGERARRWSAGLVPVALALAFLGKQIPTLFAAPLALAIVLAPGAQRLRGRLRPLIAGAALATAAVGLAALLLGVEGRRVATYFFTLPAREGRLRLTYVPDLASALHRANEIVPRLGLWTPTLVHALALGALLALAIAAVRERVRGRALPEPARRAAALAALAEALFLVCLAFVVLTSNQPEIGIPYLFVALGVLHQMLRVLRPPGTGRAAKLARAAVIALATVLALLAVHDAWRFNRQVNATREVNDIVFDAERARRAAPELPAGLAFLQWDLPERYGYGPGELRRLVDLLREREGNFLLIGDTSILYGLSGKPSQAPSLWFHPGLTVPWPDDEELFRDYEDRLLARFEEGGVRRVVLEGEATWTGRRLTDFPRVADLVRRRRGEITVLGPFRVIELR